MDASTNVGIGPTGGASDGTGWGGGDDAAAGLRGEVLGLLEWARLPARVNERIMALIVQGEVVSLPRSPRAAAPRPPRRKRGAAGGDLAAFTCG